MTDAPRFGPTLDDLFEQEERAKQEQRQVRVTFHNGDTEVIRTFADTPEGRAGADKLAHKLLANPNVHSVEVTRAGTAAPHARTEGGRTGPSGMVATGGLRQQAPAGEGTGTSKPINPLAAVPARTTSNICAHCRPEVGVGPSGKQLRHSWSCPVKKGQPISAKEYAKGREWHPSMGGSR